MNASGEGSFGGREAPADSLGGREGLGGSPSDKKEKSMNPFR